MALARAFLAGLLALLPVPAFAAPPTPEAGAPRSQDAAPAQDASPKDETLVYIFSGVLTGTGETYSGTLVARAEGPEFELKLAGGTTCDGSKLEPDKGLLRLPETPCSDGRPLKALFVYQAGDLLRVYGTIGGERFSTQAHALPSDAPEAAPAKPAAPPADLMDRAK